MTHAIPISKRSGAEAALSPTLLGHDLRAEIDEDRRLNFRLRDNGPGFRAAAQAHLFEPGAPAPAMDPNRLRRLDDLIHLIARQSPPEARP